MINKPIAMYADGGVIEKNPSPIGGTFAVRIIHADNTTEQHSGIILPKHGMRGFVSNNISELAAVVCGLSKLPDLWRGIIYSDSWVTLQRVFHGAKMNNVPEWLEDKMLQEMQRLEIPRFWERLTYQEQLKRHERRGITYVLLDGHPTKAQLAEGIGKRGNPVSEHNVWCDKECQRLAREYKGSVSDAKHTAL